MVELGDTADEFVRDAKDLLIDMEKRIHEDTGLILDAYLTASDKFDEAFAAMRNRQWKKALTGFQEVAAVNQKHPQSYGNMGICYAQLGRKQEAIAAFDKALELDPNYEPAMLNRAIVDSLKDGEKLPDDKFESVEYYKEYPLKKKSLFEHFFG